MNSSPESTKDTPDIETKSGFKNHSAAILTSKIGCLSSFILALLAISTIFFEKGDTTGPEFFILGLLAIIVLVVSGAIAIFTSLVGITNGIITAIEDKEISEEIKSGVINNVILILGVLLALIFVYKLLRF